MIISASRRTDIPAFYSEWLFNRIDEGFACVRNPMNPRQVSRIQLTPDVADGFVFWTKNPAPMLPHLHELRRYAYYFLFTITPYRRDLETNLPDKSTLIHTFQQLSHTIGPNRVIWRYDPIVVNKTYTGEFHLHKFEEMARQLKGCTNKVIVSFLDMDYRNAKRNAALLQTEALPPEERKDLASTLAAIARMNGMEMSACAETTINLAKCGITPSRCVDAELMGRLLGTPLRIGKDRTQRPGCQCDASIDIGMYNTCGNGCRYCYANYNAGEIAANRQKHNPNSPLLVGDIEPMDNVTERAMQSGRDGQIKFKY